MGKVKILFVFLIILNTIFGQEKNKEQKNHLQPNIRAIQFGITDFFRFTSFSGTSISIKKHLSKKNAIRIGLSTNKSYFDDYGKKIVSNVDYDEVSNKSKYLDLDMDYYTNISTQFIRYIKSYTSLYPYIGIGIEAIYSGQEYNSENTNNYRIKNNYKKTTYSFGIVIPIGIEYFLNDCISFHSEYISDLKFGKNIYKDKQIKYYPNTTEKTTNNSKEPFYELHSFIRFGMSFYF